MPFSSNGSSSRKAGLRREIISLLVIGHWRKRMPRIIFRDFDEFADSIGGIAGRFVPTARSEKDWWVEAVPAGRVSLQQVQIGGATTFVGDGASDCITVGMPMIQPARVRIDGNLLDSSSFVFLKERQPFTFCTPAATRWAGVTIPLDHALLQPELPQLLNSASIRDRGDSQLATNSAHLGRMRMLVSRMCAEENGVNIRDATAARAAEEEIAVMVARMLEESSRAAPVQCGRPKVARGQVISRVLALMDARAGQSLLVDDLCRAADVSERTLRSVFHEYFGVGPIQLLRLRQLREVRLALLAADSAHDTVASVIARFGIWDFSLFARKYKALYGESPAFTLRKAPIRRQRNSGETWLRYAARVFSSYATVSRGDVAAPT